MQADIALMYVLNLKPNSDSSSSIVDVILSSLLY